METEILEQHNNGDYDNFETITVSASQNQVMQNYLATKLGKL